MNKNASLIIAIDGFSSCGKSTIAKDLAKAMEYRFIDSGAMYRAVSYYFLENNIDVNNASTQEIENALKNLTIHFENINGVNTVFLNNTPLTTEIRSGRVSSIVSEVAAKSHVRSLLVAMQQSYAKSGGLVMDGRDIGSVVFPNADIKFFVSADIDIRSQRRYDELVGTKNELSLVDVKKNLSHRDHIDSTRADSPLIQTPDAVVIDTSHHTRQSQLEEVMKYVNDLIQARQSS